MAHKSLRRKRGKCETRAICLNTPSLTWPPNSAAASMPIQPMLSPSSGSTPIHLAASVVMISLRQATRLFHTGLAQPLRLDHEVGDDAPVGWLQARPVGVEECPCEQRTCRAAWFSGELEL